MIVREVSRSRFDAVASVGPTPSKPRRSIALDAAGTTVGERVRAARTRLGWSRQTLEDRSSISAVAIKKLENGDTSPECFTLGEIARALQTSIDALWYGQQEASA